MNENAGDACPYCGTIHPAGVRERGYYRCHGCNFFIQESWLVDDAESWVLDSVHRLLCPWCGFPAGSEQKLRAEGETACGGCAGSLTTDILVTQAELRVERDSSHRARTMILIASSLLFLFIILLAILR